MIQDDSSRDRDYIGVNLDVDLVWGIRRHPILPTRGISNPSNSGDADCDEYLGSTVPVGVGGRH